MERKLLLLLRSFSRVRLCATPQMAAHQAAPSLGFSRQEHWSGLPFPSPRKQQTLPICAMCREGLGSRIHKCNFHPTFDFQNLSHQPWALQPNISVLTNTNHPCLLFIHCYQIGKYLFEDNWTCKIYFVELIK